jgi:hypothetical protein
MITLSTEEDYNKVCEEVEYFRNSRKKRWRYTKKVLDMLKPFCGNINTSLEIGTSGFQCIRESVIPPVKFDAMVNWPYQDKQFDMTIALQVWEHLWSPKGKKIYKNKMGTPKQKEAFNELKRVSKNAILSVPYDWGEWTNTSPVNVHYGITMDTILEWSSGFEPVEIVDVPNEPGRVRGSRRIFRWDFKDD